MDDASSMAVCLHVRPADTLCTAQERGDQGGGVRGDVILYNSSRQQPDRSGAKEAYDA
jgi:hypothetical protein